MRFSTQVNAPSRWVQPSDEREQETRLAGIIRDCDELIADLERWREHGTYADHPLARTTVTDFAPDRYTHTDTAIERAFGVRVRIALIEAVEEGALDPSREIPTTQPIVAAAIPSLIDELRHVRTTLARGARAPSAFAPPPIAGGQSG